MPADLRAFTSLFRWLSLGLVALAIAFLPWPGRAASPTARTFRVEASSFAYQPGEISVNPGDWVTIDLVATDYVHGLEIDGYGLNVTADPGQTARLTFTADRAGTFRLRCSVPCGPAHPFMIGKLHVGQNTLFYRAAGLAALAAIAALWVIHP
jgi:heme/copper-type cytochrome/quinol oxidase subunit 2